MLIDLSDDDLELIKDSLQGSAARYTIMARTPPKGSKADRGIAWAARFQERVNSLCTKLDTRPPLDTINP